MRGRFSSIRAGTWSFLSKIWAFLLWPVKQQLLPALPTLLVLFPSWPPPSPPPPCSFLYSRFASLLFMQETSTETTVTFQTGSQALNKSEKKVDSVQSWRDWDWGEIKTPRFDGRTGELGSRLATVAYSSRKGCWSSLNLILARHCILSGSALFCTRITPRKTKHSTQINKAPRLQDPLKELAKRPPSEME